MSPPPNSPSRKNGKPPAYAVSRRRPRLPRRWLTAFAGIFLLGAAWAFATPYDGTPDEMQHIMRASGVVHGDIAPEGITFESGTDGKRTITDQATGAEQTVAKSLVRENCWAFSSNRTVACAQEPGGDDTLVKVPTRAGRYNPVYYLLVGWPLALSPDWTGVMGARLTSLALTSALLSAALVAVTSWTRRRLMIAGAIAALTPITMHMSAAVNPSGLEIAAGFALFATLTPIFLDPGAPVRRPALVVALIAALTIVTLRSLGPAWLVIILLVLAVPRGRLLLKRAWARRGTRAGLVAVALAAVAGAAWTVVMRVNEAAPQADTPDFSFLGAVKVEIVLRWGDYLTEMIGRTSWLDVTMPFSMYYLWYSFLAALVLPALMLARRADRVRLACLIALVFLVPTVSDAWGAAEYGFMAQGRYLLPFAVGVPMIAALALDRIALLDRARTTRVIRSFALVLWPAQLVFLVYTMVRWQSGVRNNVSHVRVNPLNGPWHPPLGSVLPLVLGVCGVAVLVWFAFRVTRDLPARIASATDLGNERREKLSITA